MVSDTIDRNSLFSISVVMAVWLATNRAKNFAGIEMHSLKMCLNGFLIRLFINCDSGMVYSLCQLEKVCINYLKVWAFAKYPVFFW